MNIGACRVKIRLPENQTLKGKRQVIRSVADRVRHRFNVSIAEVEDNGLWQIATLGVTCVSNDAHFTNEVLSKVVNLIEESLRGEAEVLDCETEIIKAF